MCLLAFWLILYIISNKGVDNMFTGIVQGARPITTFYMDYSIGRLAVDLGPELSQNLEIGCSISVDGVCLTAVRLTDHVVDFDIIKGTLERTTIPHYKVGQLVNVERSMTQTTEIGGHELSGHVDCQGKIANIEIMDGNTVIDVELPPQWMKYIFAHGFVAVNGVSLTVSKLDKHHHCFSVWLIPETLRRTNLGKLTPGDLVNIEIHRGVQVLVDTIEDAVERVLISALRNGELDAKHVQDLLGATQKLFGKQIS